MTERKMFMVVTREAWERAREVVLDQFKRDIQRQFPNGQIVNVVAREENNLLGPSTTVGLLATINVPEDAP